MRELTDFEKAVNKLRIWQRHHLLRQFGDNGLVLPENLELSRSLDRVLEEICGPGAVPDDANGPKD